MAKINEMNTTELVEELGKVQTQLDYIISRSHNHDFDDMVIGRTNRRKKIVERLVVVLTSVENTEDMEEE